MELDVMQKRAIFKALATKSQIEVGKEFGFDKYFKTNSAIKYRVNTVYNEVKENPSTFSIEPELLEIVEKALESRKVKKQPVELLEVEQVNEKQLVVGAGKKAWILLNKKLDYLEKNKKAFEEESIMNLAKIAGIAFDKSQIVRGEATENIMVRAKINKDITPEEAVAQLLQFREVNTIEDGNN